MQLIGKSISRFIRIAAIVICGLFTVGVSFANDRAQIGADNLDLPPDVEMQITNFELQNFVEGTCRVRIKARQMIRRGKKILGFRSNLVKNNVFYDMSGELTTPISKVNFSSGYAEWDMKAASSLLLTDNVSLNIQGKKVPVLKKAKIDFRNATIRVDDRTTLAY